MDGKRTNMIRIPQIFLGYPSACACNVYQAFLLLNSKGLGYKAKILYTLIIIVILSDVAIITYYSLWKSHSFEVLICHGVLLLSLHLPCCVLEPGTNHHSFQFNSMMTSSSTCPWSQLDLFTVFTA